MNWHAQDEMPDIEMGTALVAVPDPSHDPATFPIRLDQLYCWDGMDWRGEIDNEPVPSDVFWWAYECDVLNPLNELLRGRHV